MRNNTLKTLFVVATTLAVTSGPALAQGGGSSIGVGVEQMLMPGTGFAGGPAGPAFVYDPGPWHLDAILHLVSSNGSQLGLGARAFYVLHRSSAADFSIGGGLGLLRNDPDGPSNDRTDFNVEGAAQIRAFITSNVALSTTFGIGIALRDGQDDVFAFGGQFLGSLGLVYFFR